MMATAFIGYVLPWGQMSFWGATVITNLFSAVPFFGILIIKKYNAKKLCKKINRNLGVIYIKKVFAQQKILGFLRLICLLLWH